LQSAPRSAASSSTIAARFAASQPLKAYTVLSSSYFIAYFNIRCLNSPPFSALPDIRSLFTPDAGKSKRAIALDWCGYFERHVTIFYALPL
jgi:hypothetical protein